MRFTYLAVWAGATTLAVSLSWLGVRHVLRDAVFDRPAPIAVGPVISRSPTAATSTPRPKKAPSASSTPEPTPTATRPPTPGPKPTASPAGNITTRSTACGRVTLKVGASSVSLVYAYPEPGYQVRPTQTEYLMRVDFVTSTAKSCSVIASWYQTAPKIETFEYQT